MRLTDEDLKVIAQDLPNDVGRSSDARSRILCVQEILRYATDAEHGLTTYEIAKILAYRADDGQVPSETTVLADIHAIAKNKPLDMEISVPTRGKTDGFKCVKSLLRDVEVRMLQNLVRASKFITNKQARNLSNSLDNLLSFYDQDKITKTVFVDMRKRTSGPAVLEASQKISEALSAGKKIEFQYVNWNLKNKMFRQGMRDGEVKCETPVNLIYSFDNYYVEMFDERGKHQGSIFTRRLDRMRDVRVSEIDAVKNDEIKELQKTVEERTLQTFDMLGGDVVELFLEIHWKSANMIYNRFGNEYKFENLVYDEQGRPTVGYIRVSVQLSPTFLRWIFGFRGTIRIVPPENSIWNTAGSWSKLKTSNRSIVALQKDYDKAVREYNKMLEFGKDAIG